MAVKLSDAFIQINASMDGFQRKVSNELAGLGKVGQKAGKDVGDSFTKKFGDEAKSLDSSVKKGLDGAGAAGKSAGQDIGSQMSKSVNDALGSIDFGSLVKKAGVAGTAIAGAASLGELVSAGREVSGQIGALNRELGLTGDVAKGMGDEVSQLMRSGVVGSAEEAAAAVGAMKSQFQDMPTDQIDGLADNLSAFAKTFEMDVAESTQIAGQLITNGLATDVESAADMMTVSMQKVPQAMRGEIGDAISEYGTNFANLGYSGEEAFSMLVAAAEGGQYQIDKTGDAIKEFSVLAIDPAKAEVFESLGINATDAARAVAEGGEGARKTLEQTAQKLLEMEDPGARAAAAVELFGAPVEDLGVDKIPAFLEGLSGTAEGLGDVEGASQRLSDSMANSLQGRLDAAKGWLQSLAGDGFMAVWDATQWVINGVGKLAGPVTDSLGEVWGKVQEFGGGVRDILFEGDYTGLPFGLQEDSGFVDVLFNAREMVTGIGDILFRGDYTGLPFGLGEDSGFVDFLFNARESFFELRDDLTVAWDELKAALTGGDWGYGALASLIGEDNAKGLIDTIAGVGERFRDFRDQVVDAFNQAKEIAGPVLEWLGEFLKDQLSGTLESLWESLKSVGSAFGSIAQSVGGAFLNALKGAWDILLALWDLLSPLLLPILKTIGAIVGGVVVGAFMALVGAVRLVSEVIEVVANVIQWLAENVLSPLIGVVSTVASFFQDVLAGAFNLARDVFSQMAEDLKSDWQMVSDTFTAVWNWVKANVFDAFGLKMQELEIWWMNTTGKLKAAWQDVSDVFSAVWEIIKTAVFDAWNAYVNQVKANWDTVTNALNTAWTWVKDTFTNTWNAIKTGVFDAWNNVVDGVKSTWERITTSISDKWTWLKDQLHTVWRWVDDNVFEKMKSALTVVKDSFGTAADGIKVLWDRVRAAAAAPIRFVIDTVVNKGLIGAWNKVTGWVGLDPVDTIPLGELGSYATGTSRVPGPRSVGRDNMRFISEDGRHAINLAGQEGIAHQHVVDAIGAHNWDRLNAAAVIGGPNAVMRELGSFAGGGVVGSITGLVNRHFPMMTITSTYRNTNDHHGAGRAVDFSNGTDTTPQMQAAAAWFAQNYGPGLLELIHSPSPYNIKNGRSVGDGFGFYGAGTMAGHRNHVHVAAAAPLGAPGTPPPDLGDLPAGSNFSLSGMVKGLWDKAIGSIGKWDGGGLIGELPAAFAKSAASKLWDHISDKINIFDTGGVLEHGGVAKNMSGKPEAILTNAQWGQFNKMVGNMPALTESLEVIAEEIGAAFNGGDWGMGELASVLGDEKLAESIINGAAALGEISRTIGEQAQKSATDYATTQATDALDVMGLGGLVPLGQKLGAKAWDLYQASPYEVGFNGQSVTVEIEAESDADLIRVSEFKRLADQVHGLDVKVNQRPSAASITRGGVM